MRNSLDNYDLAILRLLQKDAQAKLKDISAQINLSISPTHDRIKWLEEDKYIEEYVALLNRKKLGFGLTIYCQITLTQQTNENFYEFEQAITNLPEVMGCSLISGSVDYLLVVMVADVAAYNQFYQEKLSLLPNVAHINSLFVMREIKDTRTLPI